ncbi:MAG: AtpZ/AtpI family protein [Propionibacteriaceae bacterium]|jgi:F0F1-type ATP synthase assembly protein I|nr:AtpZ/AtpI family protein [Propionibacteriaceae bacterium]
MSKFDTSEDSDGTPDGSRVFSELLAGVLLYGGIGWLLDRFWLGSGWATMIGVLFGLLLGMFIAIKRYGVW